MVHVPASHISFRGSKSRCRWIEAQCIQHMSKAVMFLLWHGMFHLKRSRVLFSKLKWGHSQQMEATKQHPTTTSSSSIISTNINIIHPYTISQDSFFSPALFFFKITPGAPHIHRCHHDPDRWEGRLFQSSCESLAAREGGNEIKWPGITWINWAMSIARWFFLLSY